MALATLFTLVVSSRLLAQAVVQVAPRPAVRLQRSVERPSRMLHVTNRRLAQRLLKGHSPLASLVAAGATFFWLAQQGAASVAAAGWTFV